MNQIERYIDSMDWATLVLFISLGILALGKYVFAGHFKSFVILPFNNRYILLYNKKGKLFGWFHTAIFIFQIINFSLFAVLALTSFYPQQFNDPVRLFFLVLGGISLYHLLKVSIQFAPGIVFDSNSLIKDLIFNKTSYLNYSGLLLCVFNILAAYVFTEGNAIYYLGIGVFLLINAVGFFNIINTYKKVLASNLLYFILYLCTLEIAPLVIIGSYLKVGL